MFSSLVVQSSDLEPGSRDDDDDFIAAVIVAIIVDSM
jgi:hypothetical protein